MKNLTVDLRGHTGTEIQGAVYRCFGIDITSEDGAHIFLKYRQAMIDVALRICDNWDAGFSRPDMGVFRRYMEICVEVFGDTYEAVAAYAVLRLDTQMWMKFTDPLTENPPREESVALANLFAYSVVDGDGGYSWERIVDATCVARQADLLIGDFDSLSNVAIINELWIRFGAEVMPDVLAMISMRMTMPEVCTALLNGIDIETTRSAVSG